jgi:hypothetical protein
MCLYSQMYTAPPPSDPTAKPDPNRAGTGTAAPTPVGRLLSLVRRLIDYGQNLAAMVQQRPSGPAFDTLAAAFGTLDLTLIIARIACGLRRAVLLQARLNRLAASGKEPYMPLARKPDEERKPRPKGATAGAGLEARAESSKQPRQPREQTPDGLPTEEQIAAAVRYKSIGDVILDICLDLGITPGQVEYGLYHEILKAGTYYTRDLARFIRELTLRLLLSVPWPGDSGEPPKAPHSGHPSPALATGPP